MIQLSDNTNRWGSPPAAREAIARALAGDGLRDYPSAYSDELREAAGEYLDVSPDCVVTGCGSDDILDIAFRALALPGARIAIPDPTFVMAPIFARNAGLEVVRIPLRDTYDVDVDAVIDAKPAIVYLCSPNNPTGTPLAADAIDAILAGTRAVLVVDEAYAEFSGWTVAARASSDPRLIVVRTLSKAFGLAGLRVGYAVATPAVIRRMETFRGPYRLGALAESAAVAALHDGKHWMQRSVAEAIDARAKLVESLRDRAFAPAPSSANFVFVPTTDAASLARSLRERGVSVRLFNDLPRINSDLDRSGGCAIRISVAPWPEMARALQALDEVLACA